MPRIAIPGFWTVVALATATVAAGQGGELKPSGSGARQDDSLLDRPARLNLQSVPLSSALSRLQQTSGVSILFSPSRLPQGGTVTCPCANVSVRDALLKILQGSGFGFREDGGQVLVSMPSEVAREASGVRPPGVPRPEGSRSVLGPDSTPAPERLPSGVIDAASTGVIAGRITGPTGEPLAGAQVTVAGLPRGGVTDSEGRFLISGVPAGTHSVRASYPGYDEGWRGVVLGPNRTVDVALPLRSRILHLDGIVAVGYGTARRRDLTGAIGSVQVGDVDVATTASAGQMLQGRVAGALVTHNNGIPGGGVAIRIRGTASISASSEPLYLIDGAPAFPVGSGNSAYSNPLATLSPNDVASIEVLKDASSTAIYGSRGAAGVVLITTKQGQRGTDHLTLESTYGVQAPANYLQMLTGPQFAELVNEARTNAGLTPIYGSRELETIRAAGAGTDWQRLVTRRAPMQNHSLSFNGGDQRTRYLLSASYFNQDGIINGSDFKRFSGRLNLDRSLSSRLQVSAHLAASNLVANVLQTDEQGFSSGVVSGALWFNPAVGPRQADGSWLLNSPVTWPAGNPLAIAEEDRNHQSVFSAMGSGFAEYTFASALRLRASVAGASSFSRTDLYSPRTSPTGRPSGGQGSASTAQSTNLTSETILTSQRQLGPGDLDLTGGFSVQTSRLRGLNAGNSQFANDLTGADNLGAGTQPTAGSSSGESALLSFLGRANYSLRDRYLFTLTGRRDGSSRFGANSKWGFFPSAALAWRLVDEAFLADHGLFTDLKLRLSYGVTGNQEIGLYQSLQRLTTVQGTVGGQPVVGYAPAGAAPNPDLKWETTRQYNAGVDFGVLDNRISGSVDVYRSVTRDLLLAVSLPRSSGFSSQLRNVGSVKNDGIEFSLNTINVEARRVFWRSSLTLAHNRNEVIDLGVAKQLPVANQKAINQQTGQDVLKMMVGQPLGTFVGKKTSGLYQRGDACPLLLRRPTLDCVPGEYRYVDANGDGAINSNDNVILGNGQPDLHGGLSNSVSAGPFELTAFLQFSYGGEVLNTPAINTRNVNAFSNQTVDALRRWTPANTNTAVPRANADRPREVYDVHVEDGSFVRLQTVTLGYEVPAGLIPGANRARVFVTGQNLGVWTRYTGFDPEVNSFGNDATAPGVDAGSYPKARSYNAGVSLTF